MANILAVLSLLAQVFYYYLEAFYRLFVPRAPKDIKGKLVLITGSGGDIGRALALKFASEGCKIAVWDINKEAAEETVEQVTGNGGTARAYSCDVTKVDDVKQAANQVRREMGDVDILVNNAGVCAARNFLDLSEAEIRTTVDVNLLAHFWTIKEFLPAILEKNSGHIINVASMAALFGGCMLSDYSASKFGVLGLSEALLRELQRMKKEDIKVSVVCPWVVNTKMVADISGRAQWRDGQKREILKPETVAKLVVNGMRRDKFMICCPDDLKNMKLVTLLMPEKANRLLLEATKTGYFPPDYE